MEILSKSWKFLPVNKTNKDWTKTMQENLIYLKTLLSQQQCDSNKPIIESFLGSGEKWSSQNPFPGYNFWWWSFCDWFGLSTQTEEHIETSDCSRNHIHLAHFPIQNDQLFWPDATQDFDQCNEGFIEAERCNEDEIRWKWTPFNKIPLLSKNTPLKKR